MRYLRYIFVVFVLGTSALNSTLFANEEAASIDLLEESLETAVPAETHSYSNKSRNKSGNKDAGKTYMHFPSTKAFMPSKNVFFQTNIGVGFLYVSGISGNLMGQPSVRLDTSQATNVPLKGRLSYNRTPLFEYLLGYQFNSWLKFALSYQYQGGVVVQSKALRTFATNTSTRGSFRSNLSLNGIMAKVYFELPYAMIWKNLSTNPYLAAGVGPGWQSWTQIYIDYRSNSTGTFGSNLLPIQQRLCASAVWMLDLGLRMQKASANNQFSFVMGCKYNQWGQARNIGLMNHQRSYKAALSQPVRIKTVYQFAPYLGVQWTFMPNQNPGYTLKGKSPKVWLPYWVNSNKFQCSSSIWAQFNAGIGFLYFSGLSGNLMGVPNDDFNATHSFVPLKGRLSYNRTPLLEYLLGYRFNTWLKLALSYQHQTGVIVQSKAVNAIIGSNGVNAARFSSNLALDAILAKVYFELPFSMIWRSIATNPYLAVGVGPGWQSWSLPQNVYYIGTQTTSETLPLRSRNNASAVWMLDLGFRMQSALPSNTFSVVMGCKYNQWGQARNIGLLSHQASLKDALSKPLRIKTVYQFAPYLGVQWNFSPNKTSGYQLKGKSPKVWLPYWVASKSFQCPTNIWTQFNAGIGFLYFSGLTGNLMVNPAINLVNDGFRDAPLKGRLTYNRTPLFEYLVGYQFNSWFKLALSYQHQGGLTVATKALQAYDNTANNYFRFTSYLSLNGIMAKFYFELPYSMIWRSLSTNPYVAVGVGPGWQSWTNINSTFMRPGSNPYTGELLTIRQKISANVVWMVDMGFRVQSAHPNSKFSVLLGCKYNQWGQARVMGKLSQQGSFKNGLSTPVRVKTVYQFAPYLGVQWNF